MATIAIRNKEQLCVLRPHEGTIMLEMAFTLIDIFRKPFDPSEYRDHYREALAQHIKAKRKVG